MSFAFSKYSGCGNDFILVDDRTAFFDPNPTLITSLCHRRFGVGADGVILLQNSSQYDYRMRIFNADGSEAEMCGNGIRTLMKFIIECGFVGSKCVVETYLRPLTLTTDGEHVSVEMGDPFDIRMNIEITIDGISYMVHHINTGVPHLILFVDDIENFNLDELGPKFRHHPLFAPQGANFNIVKIMDNGELYNRTYERGVEAETLACGTGCAAAALIANHCYKINSPIKVRTRSNECLEISFKIENDKISTLISSGPAVKTFEGQWLN